MPTIHHRSRFPMVGTLRFAHPTDWLELICFASKRNLDAQLRPIGTTGKSPKTCPVLFAKIFRFTFSTQITGITPPVSRQMRGVGHRHERAVRCDGRESCD